MATMSTYQAANGMGASGAPATSDADAAPRLRNQLATLSRAVRAYESSIYKSRSVTAVAFFVMAALAVLTQGSSPTPMLGLLCIALISAATTSPMARYRFRSEIQRTARADGLSTADSDRVAAAMFSDWSGSPPNGRARHIADAS